MTENEISSKIIGAAIEVHKQLGPGLLESAYEVCLAFELRKQGLEIETQVALPVIYKEMKLEVGYRLDILVEKKVIVEIKAVEEFSSIHLAQILTYLKLSDRRLGLLINFNVARLVDGLKRVVGRFVGLFYCGIERIFHRKVAKAAEFSRRLFEWNCKGCDVFEDLPSIFFKPKEIDF